MATIIKVLLLFVGCPKIKALLLTDITVPEVADFRDIITLSCSYNMGSHTLNSVKWYKNNMEFFRYAPMMQPSITQFDVDGVSLTKQTFKCDKTTCSVNLEQLRPQTSGAYRCEVSGDAPEFKLASETANMSVAALPRHDPDINGIATSYAFGDFVQANCTSDKSSPAASLTWYINDEKVPPELLQPQQETSIRENEFSLKYSSSEVRFRIDKSRFFNAKQIYVKCVARIERFPSLTREKINRIFIVSTDDLTNQKLVNTRNSVSKVGKHLQSSSFSLLILFLKYFEKKFEF